MKQGADPSLKSFPAEPFSAALLSRAHPIHFSRFNVIQRLRCFLFFPFLNPVFGG